MKYLYSEINVYSYIKIFTSKANLFSVGAFRNYHCQAFWKCVTTKRCFNYILKFIFYSLHYYSLKYYHFFLLLYMHSIVVVILCSKNKIEFQYNFSVRMFEIEFRNISIGIFNYCEIFYSYYQFSIGIKSE